MKKSEELLEASPESLHPSPSPSRKGRGTPLRTLRLQPQRHKRVANGHPWVYSNEIVMDGTAKNMEAGSLVAFAAHDGSHLGVGSFNPHTLIEGRIF